MNIAKEEDYLLFTAGWQPMDYAPIDGTPIRVNIPGYGSENIVKWVDGFVNSDDEDCGAWAFVDEFADYPNCWTDGVCWAVNDYGNPSIQPILWKPA